MRKGFTLIELLIVVAIIAILAAIAVPNFLEAQVRAKSSRFKADIRSAGTALETYMIDHSTYPPPDEVPAGSDESITGPYWPITKGAAEGYLPRRVTTPIAYMSVLPVDIFPSTAVEPGIPKLHAPHYINDRFNETHHPTVDEKYFSARTRAALKLMRDPGTDVNLYDKSVVWHIHSHGPDAEHDDFLSDQGFPTDYDPTNGTTSDGDIFYFGPGTGFTR